MTLTFRRATPADLPALVALLDDDDLSRGRELTGLPLDVRYAEALAAIDADPNQLLVLAELDGELAGTLQLTFIPGVAFRGAWRGQIEAVRIASQLRGQGLGREMIDWAVAECRARGCRFVQLFSLDSRTEAHRFYAKLGWKKEHAGFKLQLD